MAHAKYLDVRRTDLRTTRLVDLDLPVRVPGQALLRLERFGLTSNNVTYGVAGDMVGYWKFFPTGEPDWGRLPVWGFAEVVESTLDTLPAGTRVFGYLPFGTHLIVEPGRVTPAGFVDGAAHRAELPAVYNSYRAVTADPMYSPDTEDIQTIFVPLFVTSFVLDDFLADHDDFGASRIVLSSASSKTTLGTALCTSRREGPRPAVVGLTSPGHVDFVTGLGLYDEVVTYDELESLPDGVPTVFVDVAGNTDVRRRIHEHLGNALVASYGVGITHWEAAAPSGPLPGPEPTMFFAPSQIAKRLDDWGGDGYQQRLGAAWSMLLGEVDGWTSIVTVSGLDGSSEVYRRLLDGTADPGESAVVVLSR